MKKMLEGIGRSLVYRGTSPEQKLRIEEAVAPVVRVLFYGAIPLSPYSASSLDTLPERLTEVQARTVAKQLPTVRAALLCAAGITDTASPSPLALLALNEAEKNLHRAYKIDPGQEIVRYR